MNNYIRKALVLQLTFLIILAVYLTIVSDKAEPVRMSLLGCCIGINAGLLSSNNKRDT